MLPPNSSKKPSLINISFPLLSKSVKLSISINKSKNVSYSLFLSSYNSSATLEDKYLILPIPLYIELLSLFARYSAFEYLNLGLTISIPIVLTIAVILIIFSFFLP